MGVKVIKSIEKSQATVQLKLADQSDELVLLNEELTSKILQFVTFIEKFYYPKRTTNKIKEFYRYDLKEFVDELENQSIKLRTHDTIEVMDLFDYFKKEINELQLQIAIKHGEIQTLVSLIHYNAHNTTESDLSL